MIFKKRELKPSPEVEGFSLPRDENRDIMQRILNLNVQSFYLVEINERIYGYNV